eukprot:gene5400-7484_t
MNTQLIWSDQIPERDGVVSPINDVAVSPDGTRIIVAVGNRVLLYKAENGDLVESLRGHKDTVYSVAYSGDGSRFASGGADNIVVIWKGSGQGLLKYNHTAPIQRVLYNPVILMLASCSDVDFGLWTPEQKQVTKEKVPSRIMSAAWSTDGVVLALGLLNGTITLRNQQAEEIQKIERKAPVWSLLFIPDYFTVKAAAPGVATSGNFTQQGSAPSVVSELTDALAVGCWDKTFSLYRILPTSSKLHTEKALKYYPCSMSYSTNQILKSSYLMISGSNKSVTLYSRDGARLAEICQRDSWIWCCDCHGNNDTIAIGSNGGKIDYLRMNFEPVHALYKERYSYRENLTEVIVHHLLTDKKVRIKCKDLIQNISVYKNKLAVQLSDRISVYESNADDSTDMHFRLRKEKILLNTIAFGDPKLSGKTSTLKNLMIITTNHLLLCRGNVAELFSFDGIRQKVWTFDSKINYARADGGSEGKEGIFLGLQNGSIIKVFVDNLFPLDVMKKSAPIINLDINIYRTIMCCVDGNNLLTLTDLQTQETLFSFPGVISACFNSEVEDLICITGVDSAISVLSGINKSGSFVANNSTGGNGTVRFENDASDGTDLNNNSNKNKKQGVSVLDVQEQHIFGLALGFKGQRIFCLNKGGVVGVDVPQGLNMQRALDSNDITTAYKIACLGATEADWKLLAMRSLRANHLGVAKNAFARLKDNKFLSLIDSIERRGNMGSTQLNNSNTGEIKGGSRQRQSQALQGQGPIQQPLEPMWLAELMAYEGHHHEAAKIYARCGKLDEAIRLFTDMRRWEDAKMFARNAGQADISHLTLLQARWLQEINDWKGASDLFMSMNQFLQAAKIIGEGQNNGWQDVMIEVVRLCPVDSLDTLDYCGEKFSSASETVYARETFIKAKDISKLMKLYAKKQMWNEAAKLADENEGKFDVSIFLSYAEWLISQDRYEDAMQAYKKSQRPDLARKVLEELTENAVSESRFKDAAYYYWLLSKENDSAPLPLNQTKSDNATLSLSSNANNAALFQYECVHKADLYYAYASIHAYVTDPFTSYQPEMLFQVSRFIINSLGSADAVVPYGISKASTLYTLAKQSMLLGAYKLARLAYDRLSKLKISDKTLEEIEVDMLLVQAKPVRDDPDHLPVCYRCGSTNPLLNPFTNKFAKGDVCTNCGHPFVRSFINFDILPLVEFVPEPSISDEEAIEFIRQPPPTKGFGFDNQNNDKRNGWKETKSNGKDGADTLRLDDDNEIEDFSSNGVVDADPFGRCLTITLEKQKNSYSPVKVDVATLEKIKRSEVFVCRPSSKEKRATFYKNMLPEIPIAISQPCHRFFHLEDFEFAYLSEQKCPYSRLKSIGEYGSL